MIATREVRRVVNTQRLGEYVKARRLQLGLTQRQLATAIDRDQSFVSRLEKANPETPLPPSDTMRLLANALETTDLHLLRIAGYIVNEEEQEEELSIQTLRDDVDRLRDLPEPARRAIHDVLDIIEERERS